MDQDQLERITSLLKGSWPMEEDEAQHIATNCLEVLERDAGYRDRLTRLMRVLPSECAMTAALAANQMIGLHSTRKRAH
ncbi:ATP/GTP-binding protein (plasmid) [Thioalkalivibrio sp. K90mix]|uniref:hypothetical protein n=1 Tax=Thioalkalivibrio sp. (strain K90mix) TaxID=396595 RepID=UPI000195ABA6|nr:hypothetical protein [Thioalkalivibrio sp. K90mix]ADC73137.1 ATP/GTP-binding protein [Thioalkalivibrio sp. K90mix]